MESSTKEIQAEQKELVERKIIEKQAGRIQERNLTASSLLNDYLD